MKVEMQPDEKVIDTWTILYANPQGDKYNGKLTVRNKRLIYDAKFDVSAKGIIEESLILKFGSEAYIVIPKEELKILVPKKVFFQKKQLLL